MQAQEIEIKTTEDFKQHVLNNSKPVIVDFWAEWCPPCKQLKPKLEEACKKSGGKWVLAKVDVDNADGKLSEDYKVTGIPAVFLFRNGKLEFNFVGNNWGEAQKMIQRAES